MPPVFDVVGRPDKSVDEIEEVEQDDPGDQRVGREIAVLDMPG